MSRKIYAPVYNFLFQSSSRPEGNPESNPKPASMYSMFKSIEGQFSLNFSIIAFKAYIEKIMNVMGKKVNPILGGNFEMPK